MLTGAAIIAVIALLLSLGTSRLVIARFLALPGDAELGELADASSDRKSSRRTMQRAPTKRTLVDPIVRRNIFDPDATPKKPEPGGGKGIPSDLPLVLLATVVSTDATFSSALIMEDSREGAANGYGVGDDVMDAKVHSIEQKRVYLERDGNLEYLAIDGGPDPKKVPTGAADEDDDEDDGIRKVGENSWEVDQEVVDTHMGNLEKLAGSVRAVPHRGPDGEIDGYRLSAIRRGSLLDKLGVKNGDVFHAVNSLPLTSIDGAMKAFNSLQSDKSFNFELTRRNQKVTNEYAIQ